MKVGHADVWCANAQLSPEEARAYVDYIEKKNPGRKVRTLDVSIDFAKEGQERDIAELSWTLEPVSFERIRRITGYLTGTLDGWNNAKAAEEKDRVKHDLSEPQKEDI